jgi:protein lifeguard
MHVIIKTSLGLTKTDLTGFGPYLMIFCLVLMVFGIVAIFWRDPIVHLIYSCLSALLFSIYLIYDTQLVLGKGQYSYSLDDAYLAAIQLYIDIIEIFLHLLQILSYVDG